MLLADSGPAGRIWAGWLFLAAAVLLLAGASRLRDRVIRPLEQLYQALSGSAPMDQLVQQAQEVPGLPGAVMEVAAGRIGEAERRMEQLQATADRQAQQTVRRQLTEELCRSALPQVLRDSPATAAFSLAGRVEEGQALSCTFYDYFFIDPGLLCIMVGQVPGDGITEALYMVVAQTTIRSPPADGPFAGGNDGGCEHPAVRPGGQAVPLRAGGYPEHRQRDVHLCQCGGRAAFADAQRRAV